MNAILEAAFTSTAATLWFLIGWMLALAVDLLLHRNRQ